MVLSLMVFATWNDLVQLKVVEFVSSLTREAPTMSRN